MTQAVGNPPALQPVIGNSTISTRGIEVSGGLRFGRLNLTGNFTYVDAHFYENFSPVAVKGDPLTRDISRSNVNPGDEAADRSTAD